LTSVCWRGKVPAYYCNRTLMSKKYLKELAETMIGIKEVKGMESFLHTILTPKELEEIEKRLQILKMLNKGVPQREVAEKLGVSIGTISRGSRELQYGDKKIVNFIGL